jgi:hypothetical protein
MIPAAPSIVRAPFNLRKHPHTSTAGGVAQGKKKRKRAENASADAGLVLACVPLRLTRPGISSSFHHFISPRWLKARLSIRQCIVPPSFPPGAATVLSAQRTACDRLFQPGFRTHAVPHHHPAFMFFSLDWELRDLKTVARCNDNCFQPLIAGTKYTTVQKWMSWLVIWHGMWSAFYQTSAG